MNLTDRFVQFRTEIETIRRDIHAHPKLRFEENRISDLAAARLTECGNSVTWLLYGAGRGRETLCYGFWPRTGTGAGRC